MRNTSAEYSRILNTGEYIVESELWVWTSSTQHTVYDESSIISMNISNSLFSESRPVVGSCCSAELNAQIVADSNAIPRMAKLQPRVRLSVDENGGTAVSEWLNMGTYYIDQRTVDKPTGIVTIHAYDAMMKAEQHFTDFHHWTQGSGLDYYIVRQIAAAILGAENLEENTTNIIGGGHYITSSPLEHQELMSMRKMLGAIGAAYGGNWIIDFDGNLKLVQLGALPPETYYLVTHKGDYITIGGNRIVIRR